MEEKRTGKSEVCGNEQRNKRRQNKEKASKSILKGKSEEESCCVATPEVLGEMINNQAAL